MKFNNDLIAQSRNILQQVTEAEKLKKPIDRKLVERQIEIMEAHHDEFVRLAENEGLDNLQRARIEIGLYSNIKAWAQKIGLPTDKYDKAIKTIQDKFLS